MKPIEKHLRVAAQPAPFRRTLLASACVLAFASQAHAVPTLPGIAYSADAVEPSMVYTGGYTLSLTSDQAVSANVGAVVAGGATQVSTTANGSSASVIGNAVTTTATGNQATNAASLSAITNTGTTGALALGSGQWVGDAKVSATTAGKAFGVYQDGVGAVPVTVQGNSAVSTVTQNTATNIVSGTTPDVYASNLTGSVQLSAGATTASGSFGPVITGVGGSIAMLNAQGSYDSGAAKGSTAEVISTGFSALVSGSGDQTGTVTVGGNTAAARYTGNTATTVYDAQSGSGAFAGSVAVGNTQSNVEAGQGSGDPTTALVASVGARIVTTAADRLDKAALTVSDNTFSATSMGNAAGATDASGRILAGNAIIIDSQRAVEGSNTTASFTKDATAGTATAAADLVVASTQKNLSTQFNSVANSVSVGVNATGIEGAASGIAVTGNTISAGATGNLAGNLVAVSAPSISDSAALVNVQSNVDASVRASVSSAQVDAQSTTIDASRVSVTGNAMTAQATGNTSAGTLSMQATSVTAPFLVINGQRTGSLADSTVDTRIASEVSDSFIAARVATATGADVAGSTINVTDNRIAAATTGNATVNTASLSGTSGAIRGTVGSSQENVSVQQLEARVSSVGVTAQMTTANVDASSISVADNRMTATAAGNQASNTVAASFGTLAMTGTINAENYQAQKGNSVTAVVDGAHTLITTNGLSGASDLTISGSALTVSGNVTGAQASGNAATNVVRVDAANLTGSGSAAGVSTVGALSSAGAVSTSAVPAADVNVRNRQDTTSTLSATVSAAQGIVVSRTDTDDGVLGTDVTGGSMTVRGNTTYAIAQSQTATNALVLGGTNVGTAGGSVTGAVVNAQGTSGAVTASQTTAAMDDGAKPTYGVIASSSTGSVSVAGNRVAVSGGQNEAFNSLSASGIVVNGNASGWGYQVLNAQAGSGGVTATAQPGLIGVMSGSLTGNVSVANNAVTVLASVNTAVNGLTLDAGSTLVGGAAVGSIQTADGAVQSVISGPTSIGIVPTADGSLVINGGTASVTGNTLAAQGSANTASNSLAATAVSSIASAGGTTSSQTYQVLNQQYSSSSVSSVVSSASIGVNAVSGITGTPVSVTGNAVSASSSGNSASNTLVSSLLPSTANASTQLLSNTQVSTGAISATVSGVSIGSFAGAGGTSPAVVSGNTLTASAVGNSAVNRLMSK